MWRSLLALLALAASPAHASFAEYADKYCFGEGENACVCALGGECTKAAGTLPEAIRKLGLNYGYVGADSVAVCQAKCEEMGCECFDHSDTPARPNENCRICKPGQSFRPLHLSGAKCKVFLYNPEMGWSIAGLILGVAAVYGGR